MTSLTTGTEMPFRGIESNSSDPDPQNVAPPTQLPNQCPTAPSSLINSIKNEMDNGRLKDLVLSHTICQQMQMMSEALLSEVFADANLTAVRDRRLTVTPKDMRASATDEGYHLINLNIEKMREEEERSHEDDEMTDKEDASDPEKEQ
ncbi:hypothetical protein D6C80_07995 [Aureobasidium pullulans]|nr:hypothetical protein D6C80_07995 [Aureobasidium pullulans]